MFKFLFRSRTPEPKPETSRERFERLVLELNEMIDELPEKPSVTVQPGSGRISFTKPGQFMDEALALPKPDPVSKAETPAATTESKAADPSTDDHKASEPGAEEAVFKSKRPAPPVPNPPKPNPPKRD